MHILVDADACPVKEEIYKVAFRHGVPVTIVSNSPIRIPAHELIDRVVVSDGFDAADDWIAERAGPGDLVLTADIPLAARVVEAGARCLDFRGKEFTPKGVVEALAARDLNHYLRQMGMAPGGPATFSDKDRGRFSSALDAAAHKLARA